MASAPTWAALDLVPLGVMELAPACHVRLPRVPQASFASTNLKHAIITNANLDGANLDGADLR